MEAMQAAFRLQLLLFALLMSLHENPHVARKAPVGIKQRPSCTVHQACVSPMPSISPKMHPRLQAHLHFIRV